MNSIVCSNTKSAGSNIFYLAFQIELISTILSAILKNFFIIEGDLPEKNVTKMLRGSVKDEMFC